MRTLVLATLLVLSACKKDEAKPGASAEQQAETKPGAPAKPAEAPAAAPAAAPVAAPAGGAIANAAEYEKKAMDLTERLLAIFKAAGKDCDKLAAEISKFADEHRATFDAINAFEKANPAAEKALDEKMKPREKEFEETLGPAFDACKKHDGLRTAMGKLPLGG